MDRKNSVDTRGVIFICTGNIFRSMTAEYALRDALQHSSKTQIHSAGLIKPPHEIVDFVRAFLQRRGIDISGHSAKVLEKNHLKEARLAVAMDVEHRTRVQELYGVRLPLFSTVAYGKEEPMPDVCDVIADWRNNEPEAKKYGEQVMQYIFDGMPGIVSHLHDARQTNL